MCFKKNFGLYGHENASCLLYIKQLPKERETIHYTKCEAGSLADAAQAAECRRIVDIDGDLPIEVHALLYRLHGHGCGLLDERLHPGCPRRVHGKMPPDLVVTGPIGVGSCVAVVPVVRAQGVVGEGTVLSA